MSILRNYAVDESGVIDAQSRLLRLRAGGEMRGFLYGKPMPKALFRANVPRFGSGT